VRTTSCQVKTPVSRLLRRVFSPWDCVYVYSLSARRGTYCLNTAILSFQASMGSKRNWARHNTKVLTLLIKLLLLNDQPKRQDLLATCSKHEMFSWLIKSDVKWKSFLQFMQQAQLLQQNVLAANNIFKKKNDSTSKFMVVKARVFHPPISIPLPVWKAHAITPPQLSPPRYFMLFPPRYFMAK